MFNRYKKGKEKPKKKVCPECQLKIASANERAAIAEDRFFRAAAELENNKKRQEKDMQLFRKLTIRDILMDFLPVVDEINIAISAAPEKVANGLELTKGRLLKQLEKYGVKHIKALGQYFDPQRHEAIMLMEKEDHEEDTVIGVVEDGYMLEDFLLKPAKVVVSKKPQKGE